MKSTALTIVTLAVALVSMAERRANAEETATIMNLSNKNVELYARWSNLPFESQLIVLAPGERRHFWGPNGAILMVRFNSTPGVVPPRERRHRIITASGVPPYHPGFWKYFRNVAPHVVHLYNR